MAERGLSEERIGIRLGIRQWGVSRLLALRTLDEDVARVFEGEGRISHAALREIAGWPSNVQGAALPELRKLAVLAGRRVTTRDVMPILARHGRDLDRAPFPTAACRACAKRTGAQADFFGEVADGRLGRCLDAACFARCMNAVSARRALSKKLLAKARDNKTTERTTRK